MPHVLVIDDDEQYLFLLKAMLGRSGYEVSVAHGGKQGIEICESIHVDLVITDVVMPEMEGLEVIMELKQRFSGVKIIAISGGGSNNPGNYLNLATGFGAHSTLTKPFRRVELLETVEELLGQAGCYTQRQE